MPPYSADLRERVPADCDAGMATAKVAEKYSVGASWVRRLKPRRRETGSIAPVKQRHGPLAKWAEHAERIAEAVRERPDDTLQEHRRRLALPLSVPTPSRAMRAPGLTVRKRS